MTTNAAHQMFRTMATQLTAEHRDCFRISGRGDVAYLGFALRTGGMVRPSLASLVFAG